MENSLKETVRKKKQRALRVRKGLRAIPGRPRLSVVKTSSHIYAQIIDDISGRTIASISTLSKGIRGTEFGRRNKASAAKLGEKIAELAKKENVEQVVLDRGPFKYHGIIAVLADAARAGGLKF